MVDRLNPQVPFQALAEYQGFDPPWAAAGARCPFDPAGKDGGRSSCRQPLLKDLRPGCFYIELINDLLPHTAHLNRALAELAEDLGLKIAATNNVHYAEKADFPFTIP